MIAVNTLQILGASLIILGAWLIHPGLALLIAGAYALVGGIYAERQILNGNWESASAAQRRARDEHENL